MEHDLFTRPVTDRVILKSKEVYCILLLYLAAKHYITAKEA